MAVARSAVTGREVIGITTNRDPRHSRPVEPWIAGEELGILCIRDCGYEIRAAQNARFKESRESVGKSSFVKGGLGGTPGRHPRNLERERNGGPKPPSAFS